MSVLNAIVSYAPMIVAPFVLILFSLISAYVLKFRLPKGGLGFDYIIFAIVLVVCLTVGGAI